MKSGKRYNIAGIIPARAGSKAVPKKNIRELAGKPLIAYTIEQALKSKKLSRVIVSTDSKEIAKIAKTYGAEVPFLRPSNLAKDTIPSRPVLEHAINYLEKKENYKVDIVVMLQPTSPLRKASDIDAGIQKLIKTRADSVTSICKTEYPPYWVKTLRGDKLTPFVKSKKDYDQVVRQQLPKTYKLNGALYVTWRDVLSKQKKILGKDTRAILMDSIRSLDIDDELDFLVAEKAMEKIRRTRKNFKIKNKTVGDGQPCFIIAEAGVNHNGNMQTAKKLIDKAKQAGADAIKFQTYLTENLVSKSSPKAKYQVKRTSKKESQYKMLKELELNKKQTKELASYAKKKKIIFLSTPYDFESADLLSSLKVPAFKIASCDITNIPLLRHVAKKKKPIILSTGMSTMHEIIKAVNEIQKRGNNKIALLQCTTDYPANPKEINLHAILTLQKNFALPIGYSDHTTGPTAALVAVSLGSTVIEKHFTLDRNMKGPDHFASSEPEELKLLVDEIRKIEKTFGTSTKKPTKSELVNLKNMRRSIYANKAIHKGTKISRDMLAIKRPAKGLSPVYFDTVVGSMAKVNIKRNQPITLNKITY